MLHGGVLGVERHMGPRLSKNLKLQQDIVPSLPHGTCFSLPCQLDSFLGRPAYTTTPV